MIKFSSIMIFQRNLLYTIPEVLSEKHTRITLASDGYCMHFTNTEGEAAFGTAALRQPVQTVFGYDDHTFFYRIIFKKFDYLNF